MELTASPDISKESCTSEDLELSLLSIFDDIVNLAKGEKTSARIKMKLAKTHEKRKEILNHGINTICTYL